MVEASINYLVVVFVIAIFFIVNYIITTFIIIAIAIIISIIIIIIVVVVVVVVVDVDCGVVEDVDELMEGLDAFHLEEARGLVISVEGGEVQWGVI